MTEVSPADLIERLRFNDASAGHSLFSEAADMIARLLAAGDAMAEALDAIEQRHGWCKGRCKACDLARPVVAQWRTVKGDG